MTLAEAPGRMKSANAVYLWLSETTRNGCARWIVSALATVHSEHIAKRFENPARSLPTTPKRTVVFR